MLMSVAEAKAGGARGQGDWSDKAATHTKRPQRLTSRQHGRARRVAANAQAKPSMLYDTALMNRRAASEAATRRQAVHYARKAIALMNAAALPLAAVDGALVRLMLETMPGSDAERRHVFGALSRFLAGAISKGSSRQTHAALSTATNGLNPAERATMSLRSNSFAPRGRPSRPNRCATWRASFCSFPCGATRRQACAGPRWTSPPRGFAFPAIG